VVFGLLAATHVVHAAIISAAIRHARSKGFSPGTARAAAFADNITS